MAPVGVYMGGGGGGKEDLVVTCAPRQISFLPPPPLRLPRALEVISLPAIHITHLLYFPSQAEAHPAAVREQKVICLPCHL